MLKRLKQLAAQVKRELKVYQAVARDPRTPWLARMLLLAAIGYLLLPFDLIPDWIPVLGMLDDVLIVPGLIFLALKLIPEDIVEEHRRIRSTL
jgi:uncharacterized membrane protein YkvA (DUF1232 family)